MPFLNFSKNFHKIFPRAKFRIVEKLQFSVTEKSTTEAKQRFICPWKYEIKKRANVKPYLYA